MLDSTLTNRRRFIATSAASGLVLLGCRKPTDPAAVSNTVVRRDVPLRILLGGSDRWADTLKTAWAGIAEQLLQVDVIDPSVISADDWQGKAVEAMKTSDVAIAPSGLLAALDDTSAMIPLNEALLGESGLDAATFFPVLREGLMKFGGRTVAAPLGAVQPAVVLRTDGADSGVDVPTTWDEYMTTISKLANGKSDPIAAEPLAGGAAAKMFLWRANGSKPPVWLFDRETFAPVIDSQPYVDVLETMKRCVDLYGSERMTAGQVWFRIATGKLRMAIAWPAAHSDNDRIEEATDCQFSSLPIAPSRDSTPVQTLVSYESPAAMISSQCRQSAAAQRFIAWLVGSEGTGMIRDSVTGLTNLRVTARGTSSFQDDDTMAPSTSIDRYASVLSKSLSSLSIRTPLQLMQYRHYAAALDAAVLSCLDGDQTPQAALTMASKSWSELTEKVGLKLQTKAWRKAQGLSG